MGCDIHPHIEVKIKGVWYHYNTPLIQRCYALFDKICGVRGPHAGIKPIDVPRGLPCDLSAITQIEWEYDGGHSPTWLTAKELMEVIHWHEEYIESYEMGKGYTAQSEQWGYMSGNEFLSHPGSNPPEYEDCRLVCWFDN